MNNALCRVWKWKNRAAGRLAHRSLMIACYRLASGLSFLVFPFHHFSHSSILPFYLCFIFYLPRSLLLSSLPVASPSLCCLFPWVSYFRLFFIFYRGRSYKGGHGKYNTDKWTKNNLDMRWYLYGPFFSGDRRIEFEICGSSVKGNC